MRDFQLRAGKLPGVGDEESIVHFLLLSPGLNQMISGKLAVPEVLDNFALLLGFTKDFQLPAAQFLELGNVVVQRNYSPDARPVAGQLELHFHRGHTLAEFLLQQA